MSYVNEDHRKLEDEWCEMQALESVLIELKRVVKTIHQVRRAYPEQCNRLLRNVEVNRYLGQISGAIGRTKAYADKLEKQLNEIEKK